MAIIFRQLNVSPETQKLIREQCKKEFLKYHPEFLGRHITDDQIIRRMGNFYLNPRG